MDSFFKRKIIVFMTVLSLVIQDCAQANSFPNYWDDPHGCWTKGATLDVDPNTGDAVVGGQSNSHQVLTGEYVKVTLNHCDEKPFAYIARYSSARSEPIWTTKFTKFDYYEGSEKDKEGGYYNNVCSVRFASPSNFSNPLPSYDSDLLVAAIQAKKISDDSTIGNRNILVFLDFARGQIKKSLPIYGLDYAPEKDRMILYRSGQDASQPDDHILFYVKANAEANKEFLFYRLKVSDHRLDKVYGQITNKYGATSLAFVDNFVYIGGNIQHPSDGNGFVPAISKVQVHSATNAYSQKWGYIVETSGTTAYYSVDMIDVNYYANPLSNWQNKLNAIGVPRSSSFQTSNTDKILIFVIKHEDAVGGCDQVHVLGMVTFRDTDWYKLPIYIKSHKTNLWIGLLMLQSSADDMDNQKIIDGGIYEYNFQQAISCYGTEQILGNTIHNGNLGSELSSNEFPTQTNEYPSTYTAFTDLGSGSSDYSTGQWIYKRYQYGQMCKGRESDCVFGEARKINDEYFHFIFNAKSTSHLKNTNDEWVSSTPPQVQKLNGGQYAVVLHTTKDKKGDSLVKNDVSKGAGLIWHDKSIAPSSNTLINQQSQTGCYLDSNRLNFTFNSKFGIYQKGLHWHSDQRELYIDQQFYPSNVTFNLNDLIIWTTNIKDCNVQNISIYRDPWYTRVFQHFRHPVYLDHFNPMLEDDNLAYLNPKLTVETSNPRAISIEVYFMGQIHTESKNSSFHVTVCGMEKIISPSATYRMSIRLLQSTDPDAIKQYSLRQFILLDPSVQTEITQLCPISRYKFCEDSACLTPFTSENLWIDDEKVFVKQGQVYMGKVYLVAYTIFDESAAVLIDYSVDIDYSVEVVQPRTLKFLKPKDSHEKSHFQCVINIDEIKLRQSSWCVSPYAENEIQWDLTSINLPGFRVKQQSVTIKTVGTFYYLNMTSQLSRLSQKNLGSQSFIANVVRKGVKSENYRFHVIVIYRKIILTPPEIIVPEVVEIPVVTTENKALDSLGVSTKFIGIDIEKIEKIVKKPNPDQIPKLYVTNITVLGEIYFHSNVEMLTPEPEYFLKNDYSKIFKVFILKMPENKEIIGRYVQQGESEYDPKNSEAKRRELRKKSYRRKRQKTEDEEEQESSALQFEWEMANHESKSMKIQTYFNVPGLVSNQIGQTDTMNIETLDLSSFISRDGFAFDSMDQPISEKCGGKFCAALPKQTVDAAMVEEVTVNAKTMRASMEFATKGNIIIVLLTQGSMQQLWGVIRAAQLLLFQTLIKHNYPVHTHIFYLYCISIAEMDVLDSDYVYSFFTFDQAEIAYNDNFELYGMDNCNYLINAGSLMIIIFLLILHRGLCEIFEYIGRRFYTNRYARKLAIYAQGNKNLTAEVQKMTVEGYLEIILSTGMMMSHYYRSSVRLPDYIDTVGDALNMITTFIMTAWCIYLPFKTYTVVRRGFPNDFLNNPRYLEKFGVFYEEYKTGSLWTAHYAFFLMVRRILLVSVILLLNHSPSYQQITLECISLVNLCYLIRCAPFADSFTNKMELFTEFTIWFSCLIELTFFGTHEDAILEVLFKDRIGWVLIFLVSFNILTNFSIMAFFMVKGIYGSWKGKLLNIKRNVILFFRKDFKQKVAKKYQELEFLNYEQEEQEAIEFCKKWRAERDWCITNGLDITQIEEEKTFKEYLKKYKFVLRHQVLETQMALKSQIQEQEEQRDTKKFKKQAKKEVKKKTKEANLRVDKALKRAKIKKSRNPELETIKEEEEDKPCSEIPNSKSQNSESESDVQDDSDFQENALECIINQYQISDVERHTKNIRILEEHRSKFQSEKDLRQLNNIVVEEINKRNWVMKRRNQFIQDCYLDEEIHAHPMIGSNLEVDEQFDTAENDQERLESLVFADQVKILEDKETIVAWKPNNEEQDELYFRSWQISAIALLLKYDLVNKPIPHTIFYQVLQGMKNSKSAKEWSKDFVRIVSRTPNLSIDPIEYIFKGLLGVHYQCLRFGKRPYKKLQNVLYDFDELEDQVENEEVMYGFMTDHIANSPLAQMSTSLILNTLKCTECNKIRRQYTKTHMLTLFVQKDDQPEEFSLKDIAWKVNSNIKYDDLNLQDLIDQNFNMVKDKLINSQLLFKCHKNMSPLSKKEFMFLPALVMIDFKMVDKDGYAENTTFPGHLNQNLDLYKFKKSDCFKNAHQMQQDINDFLQDKELEIDQMTSFNKISKLIKSQNDYNPEKYKQLDLPKGLNEQAQSSSKPRDLSQGNYNLDSLITQNKINGVYKTYTRVEGVWKSMNGTHERTVGEELVLQKDEEAYFVVLKTS